VRAQGATGLSAAAGAEFRGGSPQAVRSLFGALRGPHDVQPLLVPPVETLFPVHCKAFGQAATYGGGGLPTHVAGGCQHTSIGHTCDIWACRYT
jgi:hypothetical protein